MPVAKPTIFKIESCMKRDAYVHLYEGSVEALIIETYFYKNTSLQYKEVKSIS